MMDAARDMEPQPQSEQSIAVAPVTDGPEPPASEIEDAVRPVVASQYDLCELDDVRIPHIRIDVFAESDLFQETWSHVVRDRRLVNATPSLEPGGFPAAVRKYADEKTPDLIIIETCGDPGVIELEADSLAEVCEPGTRALVIGHSNDIPLYQKLLALGVSDYLVAPVSVPRLIAAISNIYAQPETKKIGKTIAVMGGKGGVGASTIAQNLAVALTQQVDSDVLLVDMDMQFGSASLNLDIEPNQGLGELVEQAERMDVSMLDRVVVKRGLHLNYLGTTPNFDDAAAVDDYAVERLLDVSTTHMPYVVLDIPHVWTPAVRRAMIDADHVFLVATPELACLRNAKVLYDQIAGMRPNDKPANLVLSQTGLPRRQEVSAREVAAILKVAPVASVPFDAKLFNRAATEGRMVVEVGGRRPAARAIVDMAASLQPQAQNRGKPRGR